MLCCAVGPAGGPWATLGQATVPTRVPTPAANIIIYIRRVLMFVVDHMMSCRRYKGNYDTFERVKCEQATLLAKAGEAQVCAATLLGLSGRRTVPLCLAPERKGKEKGREKRPPPHCGTHHAVGLLTCACRVPRAAPCPPACSSA